MTQMVVVPDGSIVLIAPAWFGIAWIALMGVSLIASFATAIIIYSPTRAEREASRR